MSTHTPGPWTVQDDRSISAPTPAGSGCIIDQITVADVLSGGCGVAQADANARLIAAAPELLEALRAVVSVADRKTAEFDLAHAAIAKATGEQA